MICKDSTSGLFASDVMDYLKYTKPEEVVVTGCCTDICVLNLVLDLRNFFNQNKIDCNIIVYKELVDTYDSPKHNKEEFNNMGFILMEQCGAKVENLVKEKVFVKE